MENFFGDIRSINGHSFNPTALQFTNNFRKLFFINYTNSGTGNCVADYGHILNKLTEIANIPIVETINRSDDQNFLAEVRGENLEAYTEKVQITEQNIFNYICGHLLNKCLKKHKSCAVCETYL